MRTSVISCLGLVVTLATVFAQNKDNDHGVVITGLPISDEGYSHLRTFTENFENFERNEIASYVDGNPDLSYISCDVAYSRNELYLYDYTHKAVMLFQNFNTSMIPSEMKISSVHDGIAEEYPKIAVDWFSGLLFFADTLQSWIAVQPLGPVSDPSMYKIIVEGITLVRALTIDPKQGLLFWADFLDNRIERITTSGQDRKLLLHKSLSNPLDLAADLVTSRLFIANRDSIQSIDYQGGDRIQIARQQGAVFFDLAILGDTILGTDIYDNTIRFYDITSGAEKYDKYKSVTELLFGVCMYHSQVQPPDADRDRCKDMMCSDMCVDEPSGASCMCRQGWKLGTDDKTCVEAEGSFFLAIVISAENRLCLIDVRILGTFHDKYSTPTCFYEGGSNETIDHMDLNMRTREVYFSVGNFIYSIPIGGSFSERRTITEQSQNISSLTYDWIDGILYFAVKKRDNSNVESIWTVQLGNRAVQEHTTNTSGTIRGMAAVPHEQRVYWIAGADSIIEYSDLAISSNETKTIIPDRGLVYATQIIPDVKYETLHILDSGYETLVNMHYNGSTTRVKFLDEDVYDMFVYKEFLIYIGHDGNKTILKSGDIGLGSNVQWMDFGTLKNVGKVYNIKVLDLVVLQPDFKSPCRNHNGGCEQLCYPKGTEAFCDCTIGFELGDDGKSCETRVLTDNCLFITDLTFDEAYIVNLLPPGQVVGLSAATVAYPWGIMFDRDNKDIYWTSQYSGEIYKRALTDTANHTLFIDTAFSTGYPLDLVRDPNSGYIYYHGETGFFTPGTHNSYISAIDKDGKESVIVRSPGYIEAFAIHPQKGLLFWTDGYSGRQAIWKSTMVGTEEVAIVEDDIVDPEGLAIDYIGERVYWSDSFQNKIYSVLFDGSDRAVFLEDEKAVIKTLRIMGGYLYYTGRARTHISKVNLNDANNKTEIPTEIGIGQIHGLDVYISSVPSEVPVTTVCAEGNHHCSHFCFPMPTDYKCACEYGYYLLADDKTCNNAPRCPRYLGNAVVEENESSCLRLTGNKCNFTCSSGYRRNYDALLTCTAEMDEDEVYLLWDQNEPCEEILCPTTIANGYLHPNCSRSIGDDCFDYTCAERYEKNTAVTELVCQENGTWAVTEPLCLEKCPAISSEGENAQLLDNCGRNPGDSCRIICDEKHRLTINKTKITCVTGTGWDVNVQTVCELTKCPDYITNGLVNSSCSRLVDAVCNYVCDDTFQAHATVTDLTCKENGQWMMSDANAVLCTSIPPEAEKSSSKNIAIGVGVAVGALVLIIIIIVVVLYMRRQGKLNYSPSAKAGKAPPNVSFENPRYANGGAAEGDGAGGSEMGYSTLEDDKADLTQDSWRKTMSEQGTLHVYDNPSSIVQP